MLVIQIQLNGEILHIENCTIEQLLDRQGWRNKRVAVECNGEIIPRSQHCAIQLAAGDRFEIVVAVGGG